MRPVQQFACQEPSDPHDLLQTHRAEKHQSKYVGGEETIDCCVMRELFKLMHVQGDFALSGLTK